MAARLLRSKPLFRLVLPFLATLVLMVSVLTLSFSHSLEYLEQQNPVALMLDRNYLRASSRQQDITHVTYPVEDPIPNPPLSDGYNTFSSW